MSEAEPRLTPRRSELRCAYCHEAAPSARACPSCGVVLHAECARSLARCPTLGCAALLPAAGQVQRGAPKRSRAAWVGWASWLILTGAGALLLSTKVVSVVGVGFLLVALGCLACVAGQVSRARTMPAFLEQRAQQRQRAGDLDGALQDLRDVLASQPEEPDVLLELSELHLLRCEPRAALDYAERALAGQHDDVRARFLRARCHDVLGARAEADRDLGRVLEAYERKPGRDRRALDWLNIASARYQLADWRAAAEAFREAQAGALNASCAYGQADSLTRAGDWPAAREALAPLLADQGLEGALLWARIQLQLGQGDDALTHLELAAKLLDSPQMRCQLAVLFALAGDLARAEQELRRAQLEQPEDPYVALFLYALGCEGAPPRPLGKEWGWTLCRYLHGELSADELLEAAGEQPRYDRCAEIGLAQEAHWAVAIRAERAGDLSLARDHYQRIQALGHVGYYDYDWAVLRLRQLGAEGAPRLA